MTQEDKNLLLEDLSARLPYGVKILYYNTLYGATTLIERDVESFRKGFSDILIPYLRSLSSMTEEESNEFQQLDTECDKMPTFDYVSIEHYRIFDWLNAHHFDYRGLIQKDLAIEVTKENNPYV